MTTQRIQLGKNGEEAAVHFLERRGYKIIQQNFRAQCGEVDIIAMDKDVLCFVEVRTRTTEDEGHPFESISYAKKRKLARMAAYYMMVKNLQDIQARFDVVAVISVASGGWNIEVLPNAFEA